MELLSALLVALLWAECISHLRDSDVGPEQNVEQTAKLPVIWDAPRLMWHHSDGSGN